MPTEFSAEIGEVTKALKPFFAGRARAKAAALDCVDIKAKKDEVEFVNTGLSSGTVA